MRTSPLLAGLMAVILTVACAAPEPARAVAPKIQAEEGGAGTQSAGLFLGGSGEVGDLDGITVGVDYGIRIGDRWGVGAFAEAVTGLDRSFATGVQAFVNPLGGLMLSAGPGLERSDREWGAIARLGVAYELPVDEQVRLSPAVYYDFSEHEDLLVYGVSLVFEW